MGQNNPQGTDFNGQVLVFVAFSSKNQRLSYPPQILFTIWLYLYRDMTFFHRNLRATRPSYNSTIIAVVKPWYVTPCCAAHVLLSDWSILSVDWIFIGKHICSCVMPLYLFQVWDIPYQLLEQPPRINGIKHTLGEGFGQVLEYLRNHHKRITAMPCW